MWLGHEKRSGKNRMDCTRTATKKPLNFLGDVSYFKFLFLSLPVTQRFPRMFCGYQMSLMEMGTLLPPVHKTAPQWSVPRARTKLPSTNSSSTGPCTGFTPWTTEEQKLLEQALKTYPVNTPERWEKIAEAVPGRTKKDCMKRYKVGDLSA